MSEFIGVKKLSDFQVNMSFKRDALIFDRIAVTSIGHFQRMIVEGVSRDDLSPYSQEFTWLIEQGIVFQPEFTAPEDKSFGANSLLNSIEELQAEHHELPEKLRLNINTDFWGWWDKLNDYMARSLAVKLRVGHKLDAYPISDLTELDEAKNKVVAVVINNLPTPSESTAWEQIIEYKSDLDSRSKFLALRNWITDISKEHLTHIEVEQKLEYLMDEYRRHMELHRMKTNAGVLETIIVSAAESLEDLVTFKWSKLAQSLFSLRHRKVALLESELNAPGREVAYLVKGKKTF